MENLRTFGAIDKHHRHKRSDIGKRRDTYRGKPVKKKRKKNGKFVPYISKRQRHDFVKLFFVEVRPMRQESYLRFSPETRIKMRRQVYVPLLRVDVDPSEISNPENIKELAIRIIGYDGVFQMRMFAHRKNTFRVSPVNVATIVIRSNEHGLRASVSDLSRLARYWFYRGNK